MHHEGEEKEEIQIAPPIEWVPQKRICKLHPGNPNFDKQRDILTNIILNNEKDHHKSQKRREPPKCQHEAKYEVSFLLFLARGPRRENRKMKKLRTNNKPAKQKNLSPRGHTRATFLIFEPRKGTDAW